MLIQGGAEVRLAVIGDYTYVPTYWWAKAGGPDEDGVPTNYYSAVQFVCRPTVEAKFKYDDHNPVEQLEKRGSNRDGT